MTVRKRYADLLRLLKFLGMVDYISICSFLQLPIAAYAIETLHDEQNGRGILSLITYRGSSRCCSIGYRLEAPSVPFEVM